jgi:hypothetical protein
MRAFFFAPPSCEVGGKFAAGTTTGCVELEDAAELEGTTGTEGDALLELEGTTFSTPAPPV